MHLNTKLIGWVVVVLIAGGAMYSMITKTSTDSAASQAQVQAVGVDLLALLGKLQTVNFSTDLFSDNSFTDLVDFSIALPVPALGRPNPFEKIGIDIGSVSSAPVITQTVKT
ncbi:MAG: hypothetical protein WA051_03215, partial [Minisyncoccia bacterium]